PPRAARPFEDVTGPEIFAVLQTASNTTAPGESGVTWRLLKWAMRSPAGHQFIPFISSSIALGHLPSALKRAVVVLIAKPAKPDYSLPKAYRPIALMETLSKLIEKVVAKRLLF
ncbi:uncharacterized protein LAESUDRAFT_616976, partial [Laetiporus sulphureus 93-53]